MIAPPNPTQIRGGFHHDDHAVGPVDVEAKLIRPHAETAIASLHLRLPKDGRSTAEVRFPARGPRLVIDGRVVIIAEHT